MSMAQHLPVEVWERTFRGLTMNDLVSIVFVNHFFYRVVLRFLYCSIPELSFERSVAALEAISDNPAIHGFVRELSIDWTQTRKLDTTYEDFMHGFTPGMLLHRCLRKCTRLTSLSMHLPVSQLLFYGRILSPPYSFTLTRFETSIPYDRNLVAFIESQPSIVDLVLMSTDWSHAEAVSPSALPHLKSFSCVYANADTVRGFLRGRPVEEVDLYLILGTDVGQLDALTLTSAPIKDLQLHEVGDSLTVCLDKLKVLVPKVQILYLNIRGRSEHSVVFPDGSGFPCLHTLHIASGDEWLYTCEYPGKQSE